MFFCSRKFLTYFAEIRTIKVTILAEEFLSEVSSDGREEWIVVVGG